MSVNHNLACVNDCEVNLENRIAELESRIHEAKEVYAGMEGFEPQTAPEGYLLRIIEQMYQELIAKRLEEKNG